jgi:hypothetical protein
MSRPSFDDKSPGTFSMRIQRGAEASHDTVELPPEARPCTSQAHTTARHADVLARESTANSVGSG